MDCTEFTSFHKIGNSGSRDTSSMVQAEFVGLLSLSLCTVTDCLVCVSWRPSTVYFSVTVSEGILCLVRKCSISCTASY